MPSLDEHFYRDNHLFVHLRHEVVMLDGEPIFLTRMEYRLLAVLVKRAGEVVPRPNLLMLTPMVHTHLWRLRRKLGVYAEYIETVPGVGYRFRPLPGP